MHATGSKPAFTCNTQSDSLLSPVWILRIFPPVILAAIALAETLFKASVMHDTLIGFACGLLIAFILVCFQITGITMRNTPARSDVDNLRLTR